MENVLKYWVKAPLTLEYVSLSLKFIPNKDSVTIDNANIVISCNASMVEPSCQIQMITTGTVNVEAGKKKIKEQVKEKVKKIFQGQERTEEKK
ncbi:MAG TPA: hypothetical protein VFC05_04690 [Nitrososphaeraceae archaeon]|nr:hypothetical protein [Nitrososphaeraceae archaeon]